MSHRTDHYRIIHQKGTGQSEALIVLWVLHLEISCSGSCYRLNGWDAIPIGGAVIHDPLCVTCDTTSYRGRSEGATISIRSHSPLVGRESIVPDASAPYLFAGVFACRVGGSMVEPNMERCVLDIEPYFVDNRPWYALNVYHCR